MLAYDYEALVAVAQDHESLEAVLPTMTMPCLLYVGELDEPEPVEECARQIAGATFFTLPGLDHGGAITRSDEVLPLVRRFLADVEQMPLEDVAEVMGVAVGTIKSRTSRARSALKSKLQAYAEDLGLAGGGHRPAPGGDEG